jgi:hypothetical protein
LTGGQATLRFPSRDPIATDGSSYAYAGNAPTAFVDPWGEARLPSFCLLWCSGSSPKLTHRTLDAIGLVPYFGEPADAVNCLWYEVEGNHASAALSCAAIVPGLGIAATDAKYGRRAANAGVRSADEVGASAARIHGNSASSPATAYLYRLETQTGEYLKTGGRCAVPTESPLDSRRVHPEVAADLS